MLLDIWREFTFVLETDIEKVTKIGLIVVLSVLILAYFKLRHEKRRIPSCGTWIPWLGCAIQFGKGPVEFIGQKRRELGSVFTVYVTGERMTFLTDPDDFHHFFESDCVDFQLAVQEPVEKLASISRKDFFSYHSRLHDTVKGALAPTKLRQLMETLRHHIRKCLENNIQQNEQQDLMDVVRRTMYASLLNTLLGEENLIVRDKDQFEHFLHQFHVFDDNFELGVKLPSLLLPKWSAAKRYILSRIQLIARIRKTKSPTSDQLNILDLLRKTLDGDAVHANYAMLIMFASLANSVPASYWLLTYILTNERVRDKVMKELSDVFNGKKGDDVSETDVRQLTYLQQCVYETLRMRGEGIIGRRVVKPLNIKGYTVSKGSMLMISPYWCHRDEKYFPEPEKFLPERWENSGLDKKGFVAFGGGRFQCPGRWFGMMSMQTMAATFLLNYTCTTHSSPPQPSLKHVIGVQHPLTPFMVSCTEKCDSSS